MDWARLVFGGTLESPGGSLVAVSTRSNGKFGATHPLPFMFKLILVLSMKNLISQGSYQSIMQPYFPIGFAE